MSVILRAMAALLAANLASSGSAAIASDAPPATMRVNGETKRLEGILRQALPGDIACQLELETADGETFHESAAFELCEDPALVGKRLRLSYTVENVLAESCQGDVECGRSDQVVLVSAARVLGDGTSGDDGQTSFCTAAETIVFACRTGAKRVSVCASKSSSPDEGYLQYRFGDPESDAPLEMVLPPGRLPPRYAARGENVPFAGGGGSWLRFRNGDYGYVVYSGIGRWGPDGEPMEKDGIQVERQGRVVANLPCSGPVLGELGPAWFEQTGVVAADEVFDFPE